jgi:acyl-CoA synthetase (AMP-forming)/AMP-acid ligase II
MGIQERLKSVADISRIHAAERPEAIALDFHDRLTSYGELDKHASQVAQGLLARGLKPGARIGYLGKNSDRYFEVLLGGFKARCVMTGVNWRLAPPEIAYILNDAGCEILFVGADYYDTIAKLLPDCPNLKTIIAMDGGHPEWPSFEDWRDAQAATDPMLPPALDDDVIQLYTSGTTGHPKGVQLTNENYLAILHSATELGLAAYTPEDAVLVAMPFFHVAGVNIGLLVLDHGARAVILGEIDPAEILHLIESKHIAYAFLVPAVILFLIQHPKANQTDFSSLKSISYGASPITDSVLMTAKALMGCEFIQVYGLTETAGGGTYLPPEDHDPARGRLRSCGLPAPGFEVRVLGQEGQPVGYGEVGEIAFKSKSIMKGYWNKDEATKKVISEGWFRTGDAGYFDKDGYLYIHDRVKDMIVSGGENVYPAEVENAVASHPDVADVAVIGVPDERWGEAVKAMVVLKSGAKATAEDIIAYARTRIAGYKLPKSVDFIADLPRNPTGKVLRRELRAPYWEGRERLVN